jgi:hypothetical protein
MSRRAFNCPYNTACTNWLDGLGSSCLSALGQSRSLNYCHYIIWQFLRLDEQGSDCFTPMCQMLSSFGFTCYAIV